MLAAAKNPKNVLTLLTCCLPAISGGLIDARAESSSDSPRTQQVLSIFEDISQANR
jgi:hypothetical protein